MDLTINDIKIGDHVKVKKGVKAPDFEYQMMDGWQGEVIDIQKEDGMVEIAWDAETLMNTPEEYLKDIIREGYDHLAMTLEISEVEKADKRDNLAQRNEIKEILEAKIYWLELYEDEQKSARYGKLFQGVKRNDEDQQYQIWEEYLSENLQFPVETEVVESERGRIRNGAKIKLLDLEGYDDMYGIFGIGKYEGEAITYPVCNLEAIDKKGENYELLRDYDIWFANR